MWQTASGHDHTLIELFAWSSHCQIIGLWSHGWAHVMKSWVVIRFLKLAVPLWIQASEHPPGRKTPRQFWYLSRPLASVPEVLNKARYQALTSIIPEQHKLSQHQMIIIQWNPAIKPTLTEWSNAKTTSISCGQSSRKEAAEEDGRTFKSCKRRR